MSEQEIGVVTHYFNHIHVMTVNITDGELSVGDTIHVKGHTSDFTATVKSMEVEHKHVDKAGPGDSVGIKVEEHAREHDKVYKLTE